MSKMRALIVDDEPLARSRVRVFLSTNPQVEIAGECADGLEALAAIERDHPEIVFLDVQMPRCDGLELLAKLPAGERPAIILATAHDHFAVEAFTKQVVDFLLKPFDRERFNLALDRAIGFIRDQRAGDLGKRVEGLLATAPGRPPGRMAVKTDGRVVFLTPSEIVWAEAANNYSTLHLASSKRLLVRETLSSLEERLGSSTFARVNRSALVHIDQVQELQPEKYGDYTVLLRNGTRLSLSRKLRGRLDKFLPEAL